MYRGDSGGATVPSRRSLLTKPEVVAVDRGGNVYVADTRNSLVLRIVDRGRGCEVGPFAGLGFERFGGDDGPVSEAKFGHPSGLWVDPARRARYVADSRNSRVRKLDLRSGTVSTVAGGSGRERLIESTVSVRTINLSLGRLHPAAKGWRYRTAERIPWARLPGQCEFARYRQDTSVAPRSLARILAEGDAPPAGVDPGGLAGQGSQGAP